MLKTKKLHRLMAGLLAVLMLCVSVPSVAFATEGNQETKSVGVNYWDIENNEQAGEGEVTVAGTATNVNTSALTDVPKGYEIVSTGDIAISDGWIYVEVKPVAEKEIGVNYWDIENNKQAGEGKVTVAGTATNVNTSALTDVPKGYEIVSTGDIAISDGWIYVEVKPVAEKEIGVNYWDIENNKQAGEGKVTVAGTATNVNTSALTDVPKGYEIVSTGDIAISDGWIYVEVKPVAEKEIGVNYWDIENNKQAGEGKVTVAGTATNVNTSALTDVPKGYEIVSTGDIAISDGWIYVEVKPVAEKEIGVNYWDIENNKQAGEGKVTVAGTATNVNTSALTDVPKGYEIVSTGDIAISDGWIYVEVKPVAEKEIGVNYWDIENNKQAGEGKVTVAGTATNVNTSALTDVPKGYEIVSTGDIAINDGWIWVEVRPCEEPSEPVNTVIMNVQFVTADGKVAGGGDYFLPEGVQNYSVLNQYVPEGYKLAVGGDFFVKEGDSIEVRVEKIVEDIIMNISFKDGEEVVGGGDYFVPAGVQNYSVLEQYVPEGYRMTVSGDFMAEAGAHLDISVEKVEKDVIMNIRFVTADGTFVSGGDYFLPEGIQNYSILEQYVPVGYQMVESGDFTVTEGGKEDVTVEKISDEVIVNISFIDRYGNVIAGGDYFVPEGIQNRNVLDRYVPDGYTQAETGDINFTAGGHYDIVLDEATSVVNIQFIDRESKEVVAGGDYTVPTGIHNRSILNQYVPEGYRQVVTGDIEFIYGQHYEILIEKDTAIVNIRFIDRDGNFIAGGDYFVPLGIVNRSVLDQYVPEGYRQAVTGDIEFVAGGEYEIIIEKIAEDVVSKTAIFRKGETDIWNENPDNPNEVHYTFFSDDKTATRIVPSVTVADETKELDYWVSDVDETVKLYPGQAFCYNDLDKGELEGYVGDFAFYPVYKDKAIEEPSVPGTEEPANPGTDQPSTPGNGGSDSGNSNGSSGSGSGSSASKSDAPADNSSKILPKTGYGESTIPVAGITAVALAAVCGAAGYVFIARRRVR